MTKSEAITILQRNRDILGQYGGEEAEALDIAIQALESQPCEDCVSRADMLETFSELFDIWDDYPNMIKEFGKTYDKLNDLPSVTPQKKGKWIKYDFLEDDGEWEYQCSNCKYSLINYSDVMCYCPNCGADMRGDENE